MHTSPNQPPMKPKPPTNTPLHNQTWPTPPVHILSLHKQTHSNIPPEHTVILDLATNIELGLKPKY